MTSKDITELVIAEFRKAEREFWEKAADRLKYTELGQFGPHSGIHYWLNKSDEPVIEEDK